MMNTQDKLRLPMKTYDQETEQMYENIVRLLQTREEASITLAIQTAVGTQNAMFWDRFDVLYNIEKHKNTRNLRDVLLFIKNFRKSFSAYFSELDNNLYDLRLLPSVHSFIIGNIQCLPIPPMLPAYIGSLHITGVLSQKDLSNALNNVCDIDRLLISGVIPESDKTLNLSCAKRHLFISSAFGQESSVFEMNLILSKGVYMDISIIDIKPFMTWLHNFGLVEHDKVRVLRGIGSDTVIFDLLECQEYHDFYEKHS